MFAFAAALPVGRRALDSFVGSVGTVRVDFDGIYDQTFDFVWRSLRRLGVPDAQIDDAAQDVFIVVHRRLGEFEGRSSVRTWVFGIALRVASDHRRALRRRGPHESLGDDVPGTGADPQRAAERLEGLRLLDTVLDALDDDRRAVFVLAELEQLTAPEIAEALSVPLNTVYSRLRLAREDFERAAARVRRSPS